MTINYIVTADFDDVAVAGEWVAWLKDGHMQAVIDAGAIGASLLRLEPQDGSPLRLQVRYRFASMSDFMKYEKEHAPRLREEGLARFPPSRGVKLKRWLGEILHELPR